MAMRTSATPWWGSPSAWGRPPTSSARPGSGNIISGNDQYGVRIVDAGTNNNLVQNNFIGLDITGTLARANSIDGVRLEAGGAATGNVIGGTVAGLGNVISGNVGSGIHVRDFDDGHAHRRQPGRHQRRGHRGPRQRRAWRRDRAGSANNTVGGPSADERNVLSGNGGQGVRIDGLNTNNNVVAGNRIGTNAAGDGGHPQHLRRDRHHQPGREQHHRGAERREPDRLQHRGDGINVAAAAGTGNAILGNAIHTQRRPGDRPARTTASPRTTSNDTDRRPQRAAELPRAERGHDQRRGTVHIAGSLAAALPGTTYRVEFFASTAADPSGSAKASATSAS